MTLPRPTATIYVPYHALAEAIDDPTIARENVANVFTEDQTIEGNLIVTGEINPARWAAQRHKVAQLEGAPAPAEGVRTLLSQTLAAGMSLRHDDVSHVGRITVGNYDTQLYQPLLFEVESAQFHTAVSPAARVEHVRIHPSGGVSVGDPADHALDPGTGVVRLQQVQFPTVPVLSPDPTTLDAYQELPWTPGISGTGGGSGQSYSRQNGLATRIGRLVVAAFDLALTLKGTVSGDLMVTGLPAAVTPVTRGGAILRFVNLATSWSEVGASVVIGQTYALIAGNAGPASQSNATPLGANDLTNTTELRGLLIYHV